MNPTVLSPAVEKRCTEARWILIGRLFAAGVPAEIDIRPVRHPRDGLEGSGFLICDRLLTTVFTAGQDQVYVVGGMDPETTCDGPYTTFVSLDAALRAIGVPLGPALAQLCTPEAAA